MKTKFFSVFVTLIALTIVLAGCGTANAQETSSPEMVVNEFYGWYLENLGYDAATDEFRNPLQDGSYQDRKELSAEFIDRIEEMKAEGLAADPLLCAQDVPQSFSIKGVDLSPMGEEARVSVGTSFEGHEFQVYLQKISGEWKIAGVICTPGN